MWVVAWVEPTEIGGILGGGDCKREQKAHASDDGVSTNKGGRGRGGGEERKGGGRQCQLGNVEWGKTFPVRGWIFNTFIFPLFIYAPLPPSFSGLPYLSLRTPPRAILLKVLRKVLLDTPRLRSRGKII